MPAIFPTVQIIDNSEIHDKYLKTLLHRQFTFKCKLQYSFKEAKLAMYQYLSFFLKKGKQRNKKNDKQKYKNILNDKQTKIETKVA